MPGCWKTFAPRRCVTRRDCLKSPGSLPGGKAAPGRPTPQKTRLPGLVFSLPGAGPKRDAAPLHPQSPKNAPLPAAGRTFLIFAA